MTERYRLYYGQSCDGAGTPTKVGTTTERSVALRHLAGIQQNPYAFGHVVVDVSDTEERYVHWACELP